MKRIKKFMYPLFKIILPIISILLLSIYLSAIVEITDIIQNGFTIKLSELEFSKLRIVAVLVIFLFLLYLLRKRNSKKQFIPTDIYGKYHISIYYIAYYILGYKDIDLKLKPIPMQFKLLSHNRFNCLDTTLYLEHNCKYKVDRLGKINSKTKIVNLIVSDTYELKEDKLPKDVLKYPIIRVYRKDNYGIRMNSPELIKMIIKEVQGVKKYCKEFNLFLTTPATTNIRIYNDVFHTERDGFIINVYQQDNDDDFKFKEKFIKIKC